jgi:hypothetical protein
VVIVFTIANVIDLLFPTKTCHWHTWPLLLFTRFPLISHHPIVDNPPTNPHWARVVGYGPLSLCVIHKEGLCPSSGEIKRLMMMIFLILFSCFYYNYWYSLIDTQNKRVTSLFLPWMSYKTTKGLTALTPEVDCDQTAIGLPPVTSAVFLIASNFGEMCVSRRNIWDVSATPSGMKREWYVCMY